MANAIVNRFPGRCLSCRTSVAASAGVAIKVNGEWVTYHREHAPDGVAEYVANARTAAADPTIEMRIDGARVRIRPLAYLGASLFDAFRDATAGATYDRERKVNHCSIDVAAKIVSRLAAAGFKVDAEPAIHAAIQALDATARAHTAAAEVRANEVDARLRERGLSLFPFQSSGVAWLAPLKAALLGDDMGLGKTIQALTAAPTGAPVLVVCPSVAKGVWRRECSRWRPDLTPAILSGRGSFRWPTAGEMVVINPDILPELELMTATERKEVTARIAAHVKTGGYLPIAQTAALAEDDARRDLLAACPAGIVAIADEAHGFKGGSKTKRGRALQAIADAAREHDGRIWMLTATPLLNRPPELWALLSILGIEKQVFGSWFNFRNMMGGYNDGWGTKWSTDIDTAKVAPKLRDVMLRRLKVEVLDQLPAKTVEVVEVDLDTTLTKKIDAIVAEMEAAGISIEEAIKAAQANRSIAFDGLSKARALLAKAKAAAAMEMVDELEEAGEPVVVFSAHREPLAPLAARDGWALITGETPPEERTAIEERFQRGELKGVALTVLAGGVAITLTRAAHAIFIDTTWTPKLNEQAEDRIYRIGQARAVSIRYLKAAHPIDERVYDLLAIKRTMVARSVDAARRDDRKVETTSAADALAAAKPAATAAQRALDAEALAARVAADRAAATKDAARRKATIKAENGNRNRGWGIAPAAFLTPERPARDDDERWAVRALAALTAMDDDHASVENEMGFNKADSYMGHALAAAANAGMLNDGEWSAALRLLAKYHAQVGRRPSATEAE